ESPANGVPPRGTRPTHGRGASSNRISETRKSAPIDARTAFGPVGSAQPSESATNAGPSASAVRISAPTLPGSPTRQSASPTGGGSASRRSSRRKTPMTRGGWPSVETSASNSGTTFSPATSSSTGSTPAARAASTRSSPSQTNRPSLSRCRADASRRTSLSVLFSAEVIKPLTVRAHARDDATVSLRPQGDLERGAVAGLVFLVPALHRDPTEVRNLRRVVESGSNPVVALAIEIERGRGLEHDGQRVGIAVGEQLRQELDVVAANELRRIGPRDVDRAAKALDAMPLIGP